MKKFQAIVRDFSKIPKINSEPTWLEICRYPYSRFEEICSRILAFYLNPNGEHGMAGLWVSALLDAIGKSDWYDYRHDIKVNTEEYADRKRIDITVVSDDYVIAIENKITADLYNPLAIYKDYISKKYPSKKQALVVLSLKPILDKRLLTDNDFLRCSYQGLFERVNNRIGNYIADTNQKYLTYMVDFMKTIDNMNNTNSQIEKEFFAKNRADIEEFIQRYQQYKAGILSAQIDNISSLRERMNALTGGNWWAWQGWDLGVTFNENSHKIGIESHFEEVGTFNENSHKIGIESHFEEVGGNPLARFHACITTWKKNDWTPYRDAVLNEFSDCKVEDNCTGENWNRVFVWVYSNDDGNMDAIVKALKEIYDKLSKITSNIR